MRLTGNHKGRPFVISDTKEPCLNLIASTHVKTVKIKMVLNSQW